MAVQDQRFVARLGFWELFFAGRFGGRFVFRFKVGPSPESFRGSRLGEGPRALGFSILISLGCRGVCVKRLTDSALAAATTLPLLARLLRTAKFCKCLRKRSSYAGILSTL
jgi:hypothetical protein